MTSLRTSAWEANFVTVVLAKIYTTSEFVYTIGKNNECRHHTVKYLATEKNDNLQCIECSQYL